MCHNSAQSLTSGEVHYCESLLTVLTVVHKGEKGPVWCCTPGIPAFGKLRQPPTSMPPHHDEL